MTITIQTRWAVSRGYRIIGVYLTVHEALRQAETHISDVGHALKMPLKIEQIPHPHATEVIGRSAGDGMVVHLEVHMMYWQEKT